MAQGLFDGIAEGLADGQAIKANRQKAAIDKQQLGLQQQIFDMKKTEFDQDQASKQKQAQLTEGLNTAFSHGGYEGAMDYLQHEDMGMYMSVAKGKAEMDKAIAEANTSQFATSKEKAEAVKGAYTILGRFGASILKIPEEERAQAYAQMVPVLKSIDPSMPDTYTKDASTKLLVSMGVSMPDSQLYGADKKAARAQTEIGKIYADIQNLKDRGATEEDPALKALYEQLNNQVKNSTEAQLDAAKNAKGEDDLSRRFVDINKSFMEVRDMYSNIKSYSSETATTAGDMKLINSYQRMIDPGAVVREGEYASIKNAGSWTNRMRAQYNAAKDGKLIANDLRQDLLKEAAKIYGAKKDFYDLSKNEFTRIAVDRGLDPKNVVIDLAGDASAQSSQQYDDRRIQAIMSTNPGYSEADAKAAIDWENKQKSGAGGNPLTPQMDSQDAAVAQQQGTAPQPAGEGNPPFQANRSMF